VLNNIFVTFVENGDSFDELSYIQKDDRPYTLKVKDHKYILFNIFKLYQGLVNDASTNDRFIYSIKFELGICASNDFKSPVAPYKIGTLNHKSDVKKGNLSTKLTKRSTDAWLK
jgi:hypothetical protein